METILPKSVKNRYFYMVGLLILVLNKVRHTIQGYKNPRPFPVSEIQKVIDYDKALFSRIEKQLVQYTKNQHPYKNATVLELGPGPDQGLALLALQKGAKKYLTLDINDLAKQAPEAFYTSFAKEMSLSEELLVEVERAKEQKSQTLQAVVDTDFDPRVFIGEPIDLVISNAAFEHFDSIEKTIEQVSQVMVSGGVFLADIDLQTHTRWIRDADPLNIYRYGKSLWDVLSFSGSPNRIRPFEYVYALEQNGFTDIQLIPRIVLDENYTKKIKPSLHKSFQQDEHLEVLDFYLLATKQ